MANPDMLRWRDHITDLGREKLFWKPTAVKVDDEFGGTYLIQAYIGCRFTVRLSES